MKVLYLHQYFNTPTMSGSTRSYYMAKQLVQSGHQVRMITSWRNLDNDMRRSWFNTDEDGVDVHWVPIEYSNHLSYFARIIAFMKFAWSSYLKASSLEADVVFATSTPLTIAIPAVFVSKKKKVPLVFEVRDLWPGIPISVGALKNPILKLSAHWLEKWAYNHSTAIVALSPGMKEGIVRQGFPQNKIAVIPNISNIDEFKSDRYQVEEFRTSRAWLQDRPLLIYIGTFGFINGLSYLIELAHEIDAIDSEIRILLIGEGKEYGLLEQLARKLSVLNKNLFIEKNIAKNLVPAALGAADISFSSFVDNKMMWANSANKFFDSIASGTPVALNYGGWQKRPS